MRALTLLKSVGQSRDESFTGPFGRFGQGRLAGRLQIGGNEELTRTTGGPAGEDFGGIFAVGNLVYMGIIYATARHGRRVFWFVLGNIMRALSFIGRAFTGNVWMATATDQLGASANGFTYPVFMDEYYGRASEGDKIANVIAVEVIGDFGKLFIWSAFTLAFVHLEQGSAFDLIFLGAIPFVLLRLFILRNWKI